MAPVRCATGTWLSERDAIPRFLLAPGFARHMVRPTSARPRSSVPLQGSVRRCNAMSFPTTPLPLVRMYLSRRVFVLEPAVPAGWKVIQESDSRAKDKSPPSGIGKASKRFNWLWNVEDFALLYLYIYISIYIYVYIYYIYIKPTMHHLLVVTAKAVVSL